MARLKTNFPYLEQNALDAFALLGTPLYIYSFETQRICWANHLALAFWDSPSAKELLNRPMTPYSDSTRIRLSDYQDAFARGEIRHESWTFYPKGKATSAMCRCSGVSLLGHGHAMLVEIENTLATELPFADLRSLEALRHTPLMISLFSEEGFLLTQNPAATACFGGLLHGLGERADAFGKLFAEQDAARSILKEARQVGAVRTTAVMALDGSPVHSLQVSLVSDPVTGQNAVLVSQEDISHLLEMSRQLAASEYALDAVLNLNLTPALVLSEADGRVLKANVSASRLLGEGREEPDGPEAIFEKTQDYARLRSMVLASGTGALPTRVRLHDGRTSWFHISGARIRYERNDAIVILMTDVDDVYQTTADLEAALSSERRVSDMQRRFLAIASHEFRTPLAIIDSAAQRLERRAEEKTPEQIRARAARIRSTIKNLLHLLDNTVERVRLDQGEMGYAPEHGDLAAVIRRVIDSFSEKDPQIAFRLDVADLPPVAFDTMLMEQLMRNVISNAIKYSEGQTKIEIAITAPADSVQIEIRDHGIGIPVPERDRVFKAYARASNAEGIEGTGLGLSIVHHIVDLHGGTVGIVNTEGKGTTIRIDLPQRRETDFEGR